MTTLIIIAVSAILATITATIVNHNNKEKQLDKHFERKVKQIYSKQERDWDFYNKMNR
jgi:uncharacterized membrane protein